MSSVELFLTQNSFCYLCIQYLCTERQYILIRTALFIHINAYRGRGYPVLSDKNGQISSQRQQTGYFHDFLCHEI